MNNVLIKCRGERFGHNFSGGKCLSCRDPQQNLTPKSSRGEAYEKEREELRKHKIDYEYQEIGIEMSKYFKENIWWLFSKYPYPKIRQAFKKRQEEGVYKISHLLSDLKRI